MSNVPTKNYKFGSVSLAVWENTGKNRDGKEFVSKSFQLAKNYKKDDKWLTTNNYKISELVNVIQCCQQALDDYYDRTNPNNTKTEPAPF